MSNKDSLGDRMKGYEDVTRTKLMGRMPVILRCDGKAFHSYTKGCKRPFDSNLVDVMNDTAMYLCKNIMNAKAAYVQSDEISILLTNYWELTTQSWFDNNIQKMVSVAAGMASAIFTTLSPKIFGVPKMAVFDCRAFVLPKEEVNNYFVWRQQDCVRNSLQMLARSVYSDKELFKKNGSELKELVVQKGLDWDKLPTSQRHGRCIAKSDSIDMPRPKWSVDNEIPIFSKNKNYIEQYVHLLIQNQQS